MGVTNRLVFDPTDANSIAASSSIGAYMRAGTDGDLISSGDGSADNVANTYEGLDTRGFLYGYDATGDNWDRVQVENGALKVDAVFNADFDYVYDEDTAHTTGDAGAYVMSVRVDSLAAVPAGALAGTELDYQSFITGPNGELFVGGNQFDIDDLDANNDNVAISDGTDTLEINSDGSINVKTDVFTAINNGATAVSTTAVDIVASALTDRAQLWLANEGNKSLYWGEPGVTTATGFPLHPGMQHIANVGAALTPEIIGGTGASSEDLRYMEFA